MLVAAIILQSLRNGLNRLLPRLELPASAWFDTKPASSTRGFRFISPSAPIGEMKRNGRLAGGVARCTCRGRSPCLPEGALALFANPDIGGTPAGQARGPA